jgi:hypothetical protein
MYFKYRNNNYFDENTLYIFYHESIDRLLVSKVHFYNGNWHTNEGLQYKCTSVKCIKANNLLKRKIILNLNDTIIKGKIINFLPEKNCIGVHWDNILFYYWQNINKVKII